jgi:hypothetical protein
VIDILRLPCLQDSVSIRVRSMERVHEPTNETAPFYDSMLNDPKKVEQEIGLHDDGDVVIDGFRVGRHAQLVGHLLIPDISTDQEVSRKCRHTAFGRDNVSARPSRILDVTPRIVCLWMKPC